MNLDLQQDVSLRRFNTFGIDVNAQCYLPVTQLAQLQQVDEMPALTRMPRLMLGGGSNLLLTRDVERLVIHMLNRGIAIVERDAKVVKVRAAAGESWHALVEWTLAHDLPGLENLSWIPGSVGAAPIQNIGAYGAELADLIDSVSWFDFDSGTLRRISKHECEFGYRDSIFKHGLRDNAAIVDVTFALPTDWQPNLRYAELAQTLAAQQLDHPNAREVSAAVIALRSRKLPDPALFGNAGSFFKNPIVSNPQLRALLIRYPTLVHFPYADDSAKLAAGWLIEQCGWKGRRLGAAGVFDKQALVLVNHGGASGAEILQLSQRIQADVFARFDVMLEPEPVVI